MDNSGPTASGPRSRGTWAVLRQEDNGNRFLVREHLSREEAFHLVAALESLGHKQVYWAEAELA
jgi:hypothetical protein